MSAPILKLHIDERDNISVRVSQDVQVLTCEEANRIEDEYKRMQAENAKLRELVRDVYALHWNGLDCTECPWFDECDTTGGCPWLSILADHMRELGVEVTS